MMNKHVPGPPSLPSLLLRILLRGEEYYEFTDDLNEIYQDLIREGPGWKGALWYWLRVLESLPGLVADKIYWRLVMFKNYIKTAVRNILRHKGYSLINIAGFAIGMSCCLIILLYVRNELSYDRYHKDVDRIYRIAQDIQGQTSNRIFGPVSPMVAPTLKAEYPQVETAARLITASSRLVRRGERLFYEDRFMFADQEIFDILSIPFLQGNRRDALARPGTIVLSKGMARKYFGDEDPVGQPLEINGGDYEITGVVADSPVNTHVKYALIASMATLSGREQMMANWYSTMFFTYLKVKPGVDMNRFENAVATISDPYTAERLSARGVKYRYFLQPMTGIHLHSHIAYDIEPSGNPLFVTIFTIVGFFILLIAAFNFMNLSTARAANRAKEVGLRKVVGAMKSQLIGQFLGESVLISLLSMALAVGLAGLALPLLSSLTGISLNFGTLFQPVILIFLLGGAVLVGLAAGLYPAFALSSFRPVTTIKGFFSRGRRGSLLRTSLVVVQFTISTILIIGTLVMAGQFRYMKNQHLGFDKEQKLILPLRGGISIAENYKMVKDQFSGHPAITGVCVSSSVPGRPTSSFSASLVGEDEAMVQDIFHKYFDTDFIPNYNIALVAGRAFQKEIGTDVRGAFLINEAAVKAFGWATAEEALGKRIRTGYGGRVNPIIGVTKNFHYRGLQTEVEPLIMEYLPEMFRVISLNLNTRDLGGTLAFVEAQWEKLFPANPFESFFLDTDFNRQYRADEQSGRIFGIFTILGLFIACLGLLGLASYTAETRTREIGIRKVLGASVSGIVMMLSKQFTKYVLLANLVAWPAAYFLMRGWLRNFAYRTEVNAAPFILTGILVLALALLTVSFQSIRAAAANPADSLRHE